MRYGGRPPSRVGAAGATLHRVLLVAGLAGAGVLSPVGLSAASAATSCPKAALCMYPQADYQGTPKVVKLPKSQRERARMTDDAGCIRFGFRSLIDNSPFGGTVYGNAKCDDGGQSQDFAAKAKIAGFTGWPAKSIVFPTDY
ncbi:MAG TPA: peptidase inhibitor family I36 protein [Sporichthyaceae bacterium]|jgi:hypothetical protein|nr:peptidase inhibitor family I36 protein [Sporichthyaceae bacterium]